MHVRLLVVGAGVSLAVVLVAVVLLFGPWTTPELTWHALRNASYPSEFPRSKVALLTNGSYEEEYVPGAATKLQIRMADIGAFGLLDGDPAHDAAVILISDPGGSGTFVHLVAVVNRDGKPAPVASVLLGDRVAVRGLRIEGGQIKANLRVRNPSDPMAQLTKEVSRTYSLADGTLALESEIDIPQARSQKPMDQFLHAPARIDMPPETKPVSFEGTLKPGGVADYVLRGEARQSVRLTVRSEFSNAILSVFGLDDTREVVSRADYLTTWSGKLPTTQDYAVKVVSVAGHDLAYSLTVAQLPGAPPAPSPTAPPRATPAPTQTPAPRPPDASHLPGGMTLIEQPLAARFPEAAAYLQSRAPSWSVAVAVPGDNSIYVANGDQQLETASVIKVVVMLAVIDQATREGRYVDDDELELLWPMITESDNDSTTQLWNRLGGPRSVTGYLQRARLTGITPYNGPFWGTSTASGRAMALLLAQAVFGDLLDQPNRRLVMSLLTRVVPAQRWGISALAEGPAGHRDTIGLKNGWYPAEAGWRVNSMGVLLPEGATQSGYTIAVMTNAQQSMPYGITTIEGVAARIHSMLHP